MVGIPWRVEQMEAQDHWQRTPLRNDQPAGLVAPHCHSGAVAVQLKVAAKAHAPAGKAYLFVCRISSTSPTQQRIMGPGT